ncbi:NAD-dependent epimerase/dehydratase family protein [Chloroflexus sp.]|uniref:NAD-dependent epimerase/dehydratase family protein n=1 Tax=Chloroflexus sp. TaxID=1904827 RepID=UPI00261338B9|nr:NAD-dependent epimerase/dehydratase family protein [uncultured Chloroflexus sp.]
MTRVLINGATGQLSVRAAQLLSQQHDTIVVGRHPPAGPIGCAEWLTARLDRKQWLELLRTAAIETVVHFDLLGFNEALPDHETTVQHNVIGTMELLGACRAAGVRHIVARSHGWIYGASPLNPLLISEDRPIKTQHTRGLLRTLAEVEQIVADFAARHPQITVTLLRCVPILAPDDPVMQYLSSLSPQMLFGFDPMIQLLHVDDAAKAVLAAVDQSAGGAFNIAPEHPLPLSQVIRRLGRQPVPALGPLFNNQPPPGWPFEVDYLRYRCTIDPQRACRVLGWTADYEMTAALDALKPLTPEEEQQAAARALSEFLNRRRKA